MLKRVRLVNFKAHVDTTVELGRMTVLVGPNACGKTSVLDAIELVAASAQGPLLDYFDGDPEKAIQLIRQGADEMSVAVSNDDLLLGVGITREGAPGKVWMVIAEEQDPLLVQGPFRSMTSPLGTPPATRDQVTARSLRASAAHLAQPSITKVLPPTLERSGYGLASLLANMKLSEDETYAQIVADLRQIIPSVRDVRIGRAVKNSQVFDEVLFDFEGARGVTAEMASSGTVLVLGILTVVHAEPKARIILLDDIEAGLHPRAQTELAQLLLRLLAAREDLQIVLTTHSPYLLDEISADDVRVMAVNARGVPRVARLSDHPDAKHNLQALTTGEFFSAESEDWVVAGAEHA